jgi:hypothetical protein
MASSLDVLREHVDLNLPQTPITNNKELYDQFFDVYQALRTLQDHIEILKEGRTYEQL